MHQRERQPAQAARPDLLHILQRQRARGQIAGVGIVRPGFEREALKIGIGDQRLAADDHMALVLDRLADALDGRGQVRNVRADMPVTACDDLRETAVVIGHDQRQPVQLPGDPNRLPLGPADQLLGFFRLGQRERGKFMRLLLPGRRIGRDPVGRAVIEYKAALCLEFFQLVKQRVPLVVGHQLAPAVIVGVRGRVQPVDQ